jgi:class 3 adenylate cyclase/predicted ATPase
VDQLNGGAETAPGAARVLLTCPACGSQSRADKRFCGDCGAELATGSLVSQGKDLGSRPGSQTQAERRQLTVMFCDLVGSTALSARLDPEDLGEVIALYHTCVAGVVARFDGFVAQYLGDGALIYFGYPVAHEDDAERAARAALALIEAVGRLATPERLQIRVGIGTGLVVVGDLIGSGDAQLRVVVGETPNLAARLQAAAEPDTVVIESQTRSLLRDLFELRALGAMNFKGFAEPVHVWQVIRPSDFESRFEAFHPGVLIPLIGRDAEVGLLLRAWEQAKLGKGGAVLLSGEAGIGKSRLTAALLERISTEPHTRLRYFCSPYHTNSMLHPIIAQLERAAGFQPQDDPRSKLSKLDALLSSSSASSHDAALFAELLSLPNDGRYPTLDLTPQQRRAKMFEALTAQLAGLAARRPVLMIFEDAHWIDATSLEGLGRTLDRIQTLPILLIVTFRSEFRPPWTGQPHVTALTLNRLGPREAGTMIRHIAGDMALPAEITAEIIERTDGMPLFVEEMTRAVLESGSSGTELRGAASVIPSAALAVPATLHASLMARLDRLGHAKEIAQIGSAIGREFSYSLIAAVARLSDERLQEALDRLTEAGLVIRQGASTDASFLFKHALVQDAAHSTLLRDRRRDLHARIAAALVKIFPDAPDTQPEILAHHYTEAGLIEQAASLWGKAGQKSIARSALNEGVAQLAKALNQIAGLPGTPALRAEQMKLQLTLAATLIHVKGYPSPEVIAAFERARLMIEHAESLDEKPDPLLRFSALYAPWAAKFVAFDGDIALARAEEILSLAEKSGSTAPVVLGNRAVGQTMVGLGRFEAGRLYLDRALALYLPDEHRPLAARFAGQDLAVAAFSYRSWALWQLGYPEAALKDVDLGLSDAREIAQATSLLYALFHFSVVEILCGRIDQGVALAREMSSVAEEKGASFWSAPASILQGWIASLSGAKDAAETIRAGLRGYGTTGATVFRPMFLTFLARADANCGRIDHARDCISQALAAVQETQERWFEAEIYRTAGELNLSSAAPDLKEAERDFQHSLSIAREQSAKSSELRAATDLAKLWVGQGRRVEARNLLAPVHGWFTEGLDMPDVKNAGRLLAGLS